MHPPMELPVVTATHRRANGSRTAQLNERFRRRFDHPMTGTAWAGWVAVKIASEAALRHGGRLDAAALAATAFDGHKGRPLPFGADGRLRQPLYVVGVPPGETAARVLETVG